MCEIGPARLVLYARRDAGSQKRQRLPLNPACICKDQRQFPNQRTLPVYSAGCGNPTENHGTRLSRSHAAAFLQSTSTMLLSKHRGNAFGGNVGDRQNGRQVRRTRDLIVRPGTTGPDEQWDWAQRAQRPARGCHPTQTSPSSIVGYLHAPESST